MSTDFNTRGICPEEAALNHPDHTFHNGKGIVIMMGKKVRVWEGGEGHERLLKRAYSEWGTAEFGEEE